MRKLEFFGITFGCDPEFFFRRDGEVVGAEKVLPLSGLSVGDGSLGKVIIDGVQAELNPSPSYCREVEGRYIGSAFLAVREHMKKFERLAIDFSQTIKLSDGDFDKLSDSSKKFGCMPSKNAGKGGVMGKISVNPATYRYRSAGGHIHIGDNGNDAVNAVLKDPVRLVKMFDILVGNTCVLIDRDSGNIERRKVYGQAGEFRTPPHGVEYRTLSNFWLRSYELMSLAFGLVRHAVIIVANDMDDKFLELVDMDDITRAINTNDFSLALRNFKKIEKLLLEITPNDDAYPINSDNIKQFRHFIKKGIDHWFDDDSVEHWCDIADGLIVQMGFCDFLMNVVDDSMVREEALSA